MKTKHLVIKGSEKTVALVCGKCGTVQGLTPEGIERAEQCCLPAKCNLCGKEVDREHWTICRACDEYNQVQRAKEKFRVAEKIHISEYKGDFVYHEDFPNDGYCQSDELEDVIDELIADEKTPPDYVWACDPKGIGEIDAHDDVLESLLQEHHEDAIDQLDVDGLQKLLNEWVKQQTMISYFQTETVITLEKPKGGE